MIGFGLEQKVLPSDDEVVYYYQETGRKDSDNRIVIGYSENGPYSRMLGYKPSAPLRLVAWEPGTRVDEDSRHQQFRVYAVPGTCEWFYPNNPLTILIAELFTKNGIPPKFSKKKLMKNQKALKKRMHRFSPTLVKAICRVMCDWYATGSYPACDDIVNESSMVHKEFVLNVKRAWCLLSKNVDFPFDWEQIRLPWARIRKGVFELSDDPGKTKLLLKAEFLLSVKVDLEKDEWIEDPNKDPNNASPIAKEKRADYHQR